MRGGHPASRRRVTRTRGLAGGAALSRVAVSSATTKVPACSWAPSAAVAVTTARAGGGPLRDEVFRRPGRARAHPRGGARQVFCAAAAASGTRKALRAARGPGPAHRPRVSDVSRGAQIPGRRVRVVCSGSRPPTALGPPGPGRSVLSGSGSAILSEARRWGRGRQAQDSAWRLSESSPRPAATLVSRPPPALPPGLVPERSGSASSFGPRSAPSPPGSRSGRGLPAPRACRPHVVLVHVAHFSLPELLPFTPCKSPVWLLCVPQPWHPRCPARAEACASSRTGPARTEAQGEGSTEAGRACTQGTPPPPLCVLHSPPTAWTR